MDFSVPEELDMLRKSARRFVKEKLIPLESLILAGEKSGRMGEPPLPAEKTEELKRTVMEMGLWAMTVPEEFGGGGLDTLGSSLVAEEMAKTFTPCDLGEVSPVLFECNQEQKDKYLIPTVRGERQPSFALREPNAGVEVEAFETSATREDNHYSLSGRKLVNLPTGTLDFALVFAVTDRERGKRGGITCFLVDKDMPGYSLHQKGSKETELTFQECRVPMANILGEIGKGLYLGRKWLPRRQVVAAARCLGAAERLLEMSILRAQQWEAFGRPTSQRKAFQGMLAEMATDTQALRLMIYHGAWEVDQGTVPPQDLAMTRLLGMEMVARAVDRAVRIHSGPGCAQEPIISKLYRNTIPKREAEETLENQTALIASRLLSLVEE